MGNNKCDQCGKYFSTPRNLKTHIKHIHEGQKNHKCDQCDKAFSQIVNLKTHIKSIHEREKNY